jgi:hypothetical protein
MEAWPQIPIDSEPERNQRRLFWSARRPRKRLYNIGCVGCSTQVCTHGVWVRLFRVFGDGIYPRTTQLLRPFINPPPGSPQANFNDVLSKIRVSVEWSFGLVTNTFQAVDFTRWQRCILTSLHSLCLGGACSEYSVMAYTRGQLNSCAPPARLSSSIFQRCVIKDPRQCRVELWSGDQYFPSC